VLRAALGLAAGALTALVYRVSLDNPLIFDDRTSILRNPSLVATWNLLGALSYDLAHPFVNLSYAIDHAIAGHSSFGYHVTNGILHLAVVGLLYGWCTRAFADVNRPSDWAAFFAAAIFGVHPLMGSAVTYGAILAQQTVQAQRTPALTALDYAEIQQLANRYPYFLSIEYSQR